MTEIKAKIVRTEVGRVISNKMDKTIVVLIEREQPHPLYKKYVKKSKKIHAHDEENVCNIGDLVRIREFRPISKMKSWMLEVVLEKTAAA
jgi:small subunit ribosomal protein S17